MDFTGSQVRPGDLVRIFKDGYVIEGIVMPLTEYSSKDLLVIKLSNGYNVGISIAGARIEVIKERYINIEELTAEEPRVSFVRGMSDKLISVISTGGTIVSKVEYGTGAVKPAITAEELLEFVPELKDLGSIEVVDLFRLLSENMDPDHWTAIANTVAKKLNGGVDGIVVTHGTDTMSYTASALAFALRNLPMPIAMVGSQRSSDRPSSDAALNLLSAAITSLNAPFGEVVVVMHGVISDSYSLVHRGVKVRKMHSSRRDAFQSINDLPLAKVDYSSRKLIMINSRYIKRCTKGELIVMPKFEKKVALVKAYPGFNHEIIDFLVDRGYRGIVIEGTGLGHISESCISSIRRAVEDDVIIAMATQAIFGRVNMNVYTTGRRLLLSGVLPASDMLPETAYVKLSWLLGNFSDLNEVRGLFTVNLVHEINEVHEERLFPKWYHGL